MGKEGITAGARLTLQHGGWWRPMGAASHRPHARSFRPKATQAIGPNPVPTLSFDYKHQLLKLGSIYSILYYTSDCSRTVMAADNKIDIYRVAVNDNIGKIEQLLIMLNCI